MTATLTQRLQPLVSRPALTAALICLTLAIITLASPQAINPDGVLYIRTAEIFQAKGMAAAFDNYHWPFLSILLAEIHRVIPISLVNIAFALNIIFYMMTAFFFVRIVDLFDTQFSTRITSIIVISFFPFLTHLVNLVVRDWGFYALSLFAMYFLIQFFRSGKLAYSLLWNAAIFSATLFRIEAFPLFVFAPVIALFEKDAALTQRVKRFIQLWAFPGLCLLIGFGMYVFYSPLLGAHPNKFSSTWYLFSNSLSLIGQRFTMLSLTIAKDVLPIASVDQAKVVLSVGLLGYFVFVVAKLINPLFFASSLHALWKRHLPQEWAIHSVWIAFFIVSFLTCLLFLGLQTYLAPRYIALMGILLLMLLPSQITHYLSLKKQWLTILVGITLLVWMGAGLKHKTHSLNITQQAGQWINQHTTDKSKIYANYPVLLFYIDNHGNEINQLPGTPVKLPNDYRRVGYNYVGLKSNKYSEKYLKAIQEKLGGVLVRTWHNGADEQGLLEIILSDSL